MSLANYQSELVNAGVLDMEDNFDAISAENLKAPSGHYFALLKSAEFVPGEIVGSFYQGEFKPDYNECGDPVIREKHYKLTFEDVDTGMRIVKKLYPGKVSGFQENMFRQSNGATAAMKCSEIFEYLETHKAEVWVTVSGQYGQLVDFYDREAYLQSLAEKEKAGNGAASGKATRNASRPTESKALRN